LKMFYFAKLKKGFTLIELLVVISIIGVLATLIMANFNSARERARDAQRKSDLKQFQTSLENFANNNSGLFPSYTTMLSGDGLLTLCSKLGITSASNCPTDPKNEDNYVYSFISNGSGSGATDATIYMFSVMLENPKVTATPFWVICSNGRSGENSRKPTAFTCPL
jgi:prepilin-type N-terminal cleavage/methylation domain-containing protein